MKLFPSYSASALVALTNDFTVIQDNWVQIAPLGDYANAGPNDPRSGRPLYPKGVIQRVDSKAVADMVAEFNSLRARIGRLFGGLPWYVGHPDVDPATFTDRKSYGWIMELQDRGDSGLYGRVQWTTEGEALKNGGAYKYFSPAWGADPTGEEDGVPVMSPCRLISVGFTNTPNIPVMPLANDATAKPSAPWALSVPCAAAAKTTRRRYFCAKATSLS